ncbi:MAG TPA: hypothetical protein VEB21_02165 [Terriglobales bacterium]|nr:hypothetical protein [Terriglobales bacterium]
MLVSVWLRAVTAAAGDDVPAIRIERFDYHGWPNSYRLSNGSIEAVVVTDVGPRIIELRLAGGENLLQPREGIGQSGESTYRFRGGWRLWIAPERHETTYDLDNSPCRVEMIGNSGLRVIGPPQPRAGIQKTIEIELFADQPRLRLVSTIKNIGADTVEYAPWSLPVLRAGGRAFVPFDVGDPNAFDATRSLILWSYTKIADPRYRFGDRLIEIDHRKVQAPADDAAKRRSDESKIGVDSRQGWSAYLLDGTLFLKRFPPQPGRYPDGGSTIEVYSNHKFLELEHLGPLTLLKPGEEMTLPEEWWLFDGLVLPDGQAEALPALDNILARTGLAGH